VTKTRVEALPSWFALANILSAFDSNDKGADLALSFETNSFENFAPIGRTARGDEFAFATQWSSTRVPYGGVLRTEANERPASGQQASSTRPLTGSDGPSKTSAAPGSATDPSVTIANAATVEIDGRSDQAVTFIGTTGTLKLDDPQAFKGAISGLAGADAIDLSGFAYGASATATYLGNTSGGTLTVNDGAKTARIALSGNYLSSTWTLSSDGNGGTTVVDPTTSANWQTLKVGGGGWVTGISIASDGTMVVRTDTNGAYLWNRSQWQQLITISSMPAAFDFSGFSNDGSGVYEIQVAPSNSNVMYMMFDGYVFQSANKGSTWTQTSFAPVAANSNDSYRMNGQKMAVDPNNPNIVYVGTPSNGLFVTTNGGRTWSSVSAVPAAAGEGFNIVFDPAVGGVSGGATQTIFASSYGNGVYESTNGGASWSVLSGGPTNVENAAVSSTGVYYAVGNGGSGLWSYANGTWKQPISGNNGGQGIQAVAVNPSNPNEIVAISGSGYLNISYNAGSTWTGPMWSSNEVTSADIPWLAQAQKLGGGNYLSLGGATFNPANPSQMILTGGTGVWTTTQVPTSGAAQNTTVTWTDQTAGIENLMAAEIIVPPGGDPVLASYDRPFFTITNPNAYPSTYGPVDADTITAGFSVDYASSNPSFLVGLADWYGVEASGYSTNGGQTWTKFPTEIPGAGSSFIGGTIAASTPQNIIWAPANGNQPYYTLNGGSTWTPITLPGVTSWSGFDKAWYLTTRTVTADRVLPNRFYLYDPGQGVFTTANGGSSWSEVYSGNIGPYGDDGWNSTLLSVPGEASNLFYTGGPVGQPSSKPANEPFYRSTNGGATWTTVPNVLDVFTFGFGAAAPGQSYPAIYIVGYVNNVYGIWQSTNNAATWTNIGTYPTGDLDHISTISGDPNHYGEVYVGFYGGGYAYLPAASTTAPSVTGVNASPARGTEVEGTSITFRVDLSAAATVSGGKPTLAINDGGVATYTSGSGTNTLTFSYTVASTDSSVSSLAITAVNLPTGVTIEDSAGNAANMAGAVTSFSGLSVDPPVTDAYYLAHKAALDASGNIAIGDTAADVSADIDALNADTNVTSIALTGSGTLVLTLTVAEVLNDTRALSIIGPYTITIVDTAADLQALTATQITTLSSAGVTLLKASNADVAFTTAQKESLGAAGIALEQPYSGGTNEVLTYYSSGVLKTAQYLGIVGRPYTSYTATYGANGKPTSASYSNGTTVTWTYNANGSYDIAYAGVTGEPYTSYTVDYGANGKPTSASYNNGMTATWTYNADNSYDSAYAGVTGQPYSSYETVFNTANVVVAAARNMTNGSGALVLYANGQTISSSSGALSVTSGTDAFNLTPHTTEAITATGKSSETFGYASGFGQSSITGLLAGGSASDVIDLNLSMFSRLSLSNTAAQNFAAVLSSGAAAQSGSNVTITDSAHDILTLVGVTTTTLSQNANSLFKFL
jgi:hypothetical protein